MEIKEWLENRGSFDDGYRLFLRHNRNRNVARYLERKRDMAKLRYELGKIAARGECKLSSAALPDSKTFIDDGNAGKPHERLKVIRDGSVRYDDLPATLQAVYQKICEAHRRMQSLHERMKVAATDADRAAVRAELLQNNEVRSAGWAAIDRWAADGTLPEPAAPESPRVDAKAVVAARASITRNLALLRKTHDPAREKELVERLREPVEIVRAAGGEFAKNAEELARYGLI